jgi:hypothetical protein
MALLLVLGLLLLLLLLLLGLMPFCVCSWSVEQRDASAEQHTALLQLLPLPVMHPPA